MAYKKEDPMTAVRAALTAVLLLALSAVSYAAAPPPPDDAQIAAIAVAANQVDVDAGKLALEKTKNAEVKKFAQTMVDDHGGAIKMAVELAGKLKLTPKDNDTSKSLVSGGESARAKLKALDGAAFDKAYVDNEVGYHQAVLKAIDEALIPNAKNADLKALLQKVRPVVAAHLEHAKHLQSTLK
jgi:putative membrane protein